MIMDARWGFSASALQSSIPVLRNQNVYFGLIQLLTLLRLWILCTFEAPKMIPIRLIIDLGGLKGGI